MKRFVLIALILLLTLSLFAACGEKGPTINSAYKPYEDDSHPDAYCVLVNEPFDGTEAVPTATWEEGEYDRVYIVPRYVGTLVEMYSVFNDPDSGRSIISEKPEYSLTAEEGCVIYGAFFRPEGGPAWYLTVKLPDGSFRGFLLNYNGESGTPHLEYVEPAEKTV
ncbi:MAG: hypothetical protein IKT58_06305 [Oscillospiraceae bacterium]|nr:hypothetical protein [Oscillospiraceae bacterium]